MKPDFRHLALLCCALSLPSAHAYRTGIINNENVQEQAAWQEQAVTSAPAFSTAGLLPIELPIRSSLVTAFDPNTISVDPDGVVRYVVVMTSPSGSVSAFYEGIRCSTHEVKTYARNSGSGNWVMSANAQWRAFTDNMPSRHAQVFAYLAACEDGLPVQRDAIIATLKSTSKSPRTLRGQ